MYKTRDTKNQVQIKILKNIKNLFFVFFKFTWIVILWKVSNYNFSNFLHTWTRYKKYLNCQCVKKKLIEILFKSKT